MSVKLSRFRPAVALLLPILSLALLTGGCSVIDPGAGGPVIGVILAKSGPAEFIGRPESEVLEALQRDYQMEGVDIKGVSLEIRDSAGDLEQARIHFDRFAGDPDVIAIIGPSTSGESVPLAQLAADAGIPLLSLGASSRIVRDETGGVNRWAFKFAQNDDLAARRLLTYMEQAGHTRIALLYQDDGFGINGEAVFIDESAETAVDVAYSASFSSTLGDPEPDVTELLRESGNPDGVLIWGTAPGPALLVKELRKQGFGGQIYLSHGNASKDFIASAGEAVEGAILVGSRVLTRSEFLDPNVPADAVILDFKSRFGEEPSHFGGHARDAYEALISTIREKNVLDGDPSRRRANVRDALEDLSPFYGVTGTFNFSADDHAGLDAGAFGTYRISQGAFVPAE